MPLLYNANSSNYDPASKKDIVLSKDAEDIDNELKSLHDDHIKEKEDIATAKSEIISEAGIWARKEKSIEQEVRIKLEAKFDAEIRQAVEEKYRKILEDSKAAGEINKEEAKITGHKEGYDIGFSEGAEIGRREAFEAAQEECDAIRKQAEIVKKQSKNLLETAHEKALNRAEKNKEELLEVAVDIAKRIIFSQIDEKNELALGAAIEAIEEFKRKKQVIINVNPQNREMFDAAIPSFLNICPTTEFIVLPDENVEEYGCIIESDTLVIDAQITAQLENIKDVLAQIAAQNSVNSS